jgi:hypothetical protein
MKDLSAIEEQLKSRCFKEIEELVERFTEDIQKLSDKYDVSHKNISYTVCSGSEEKEIWFSNLGKIRNGIIRALKKSHLEDMMRKKSKELLAKLDVFED